jgi:hypothetical protein
MASPTMKQAETLPLEQLRDLYERIPFVRGRARVALLHRLQRVSLEVRQARVPMSTRLQASAPLIGSALRECQATPDQSR